MANAVILYDANQVAMSVQDGVTIPANTNGLLILGSDGTNARNVKVSSTGVVSVDGSASTQPVSLIGTPSTGNSSTALLGSGGVFTGTYESVVNYATIQFMVFSDQASAASGFSLQWSPDGVNNDVSDNMSVSASTGRAFSVTPRGKFFRIVYTNGAVAQGVFRLQVAYHTDGTGFISRLLSTSVTEDNFAQLVRACVAGKNAAGNFNNVIADADNSANGAIKLATITARANAADPSWTEGNQVPASTDLKGYQRVVSKRSIPTTAALTSASINAAASGNNTLIAGVASQTIRVFKLFLVVAAAVDIIFRDGAATNLTGVMSMSKNGGMTLDFDGDPWFLTSASNGFVINLSSATQVSGRIYYTQS